MTEKNYGIAIVRTSVAADAQRLAPRLRRADVTEIEASSTKTPLESIQAGIEHSSKCFTIVSPTDPEKVFGVFGVVDIPGTPGVGLVWLLGSDDLTRIAYKFLRHSKEWLEVLFEDAKLLCNAVDERNTVHIRWLRWLGFTFICKRPGFGIHGETFIEFCKLKPTT